MKPLMPDEIETLSSFDAALKFFGNFKPEPNSFVCFRGHSDIGWDVVPSVFRQEPDISSFENEIIRELISSFPGEFSGDESMFDRLVRMQHFGLPTRLLDVSRNPLVALFFSIYPEENDDKDGSVIILFGSNSRIKYYDSDTVSCLCNLANLSESERNEIENMGDTPTELKQLQAMDRLVQFIRAEKPYFQSRIERIDLFRPSYVIPKINNKRIAAQFGAFVAFGLDRAKTPPYHRGNETKCVRIEASAKTEIRARLESLGFDGSTLFPEIDKAARQIVRRFQSTRAGA